jgi:signal peptidase I
MDAPAPRPKPLRRWMKVLLPVALGLCVGLPLVARLFLLEAFNTPSGSMSPTLLVGDHFFVNKLARRPERGDVVTYDYPLDPQTSFVKRVIGLPGDTVAIQQNQLVVNGQPVARRPLGEDACSPCLWEETLGRHTYQVEHMGGRRSDFEAVKVPPDHYFVIGDNRDNSNDSRVYGAVRAKFIRGRAVLVWFSADPEGPPRWNRAGHWVE